jgi:hypothetical protein
MLDRNPVIAYNNVCSGDYMNDDFDAKFVHFDIIKDRSKFRSIWSIYDVTNIFDFTGLKAENLVYKDHWGHDRAIKVPLPGGNLQWWDLWSAAEKAIIESEDMHHVFIEDFQKSKDGKTLFLRTGS